MILRFHPACHQFARFSSSLYASFIKAILSNRDERQRSIFFLEGYSTEIESVISAISTGSMKRENQRREA